MAGPWVTTAEVKQAVADMLKQSVSALADYYDRIVPDAVAAAHADILAAMLGRGYAAAQLDSWDQRAAYNRDIALFWTLTKAGGLAAYSDQHILKLDRRPELKNLTVTAGGVVVEPGGGDGAAGDDTNGDGVPDTFGGAAIGGGRLDQSHWRVGSNTEF